MDHATKCQLARDEALIQLKSKNVSPKEVDFVESLYKQVNCSYFKIAPIQVEVYSDGIICSWSSEDKILNALINRNTLSCELRAIVQVLDEKCNLGSWTRRAFCTLKSAEDPLRSNPIPFEILRMVSMKEARPDWYKHLCDVSIAWTLNYYDGEIDGYCIYNNELHYFNWVHELEYSKTPIYEVRKISQLHKLKALATYYKWQVLQKSSAYSKYYAWKTNRDNLKYEKCPKARGKMFKAIDKKADAHNRWVESLPLIGHSSFYAQ